MNFDCGTEPGLSSGTPRTRAPNSVKTLVASGSSFLSAQTNRSWLAVAMLIALSMRILRIFSCHTKIFLPRKASSLLLSGGRIDSRINRISSRTPDGLVFLCCLARPLDHCAGWDVQGQFAALRGSSGLHIRNHPQRSKPRSHAMPYPIANNEH